MKNPPFHLKIACLILLQEKGTRLQSHRAPFTTARNACRFNGCEHLKSGAKTGLLKAFLCHNLTAKSTNYAV